MKFEQDKNWVLSGNKPKDFMISYDKEYYDKTGSKLPIKSECSDYFGKQRAVARIFVMRVEFVDSCKIGFKSDIRKTNLTRYMVNAYFWETEARDSAIELLNSKVFNIINITINEAHIFSTVAKNRNDGYKHLVKDVDEKDSVKDKSKGEKTNEA
jgi:hypothetical protein